MKQVQSSVVSRRSLVIAVVLSALACAGKVFAQPAPIALTLDEAIARAMDTSHRIGEVRAREQGAQAVIDLRRAADRPTIAVNGGYTRTNHVEEFGVPQPNGVLRVIYPDIPDNYFTRAALQWPIYTSGRADALQRAAEAEARAVHAEIDVTRADLRLEVSRAYWALVTASASVRVLQEALERANAHLRDVRAMFDQGLIPPSDVSLVESQRSRQQMQLIEAQNVHRSVGEELKRLTGVPRDAELVIANTLSAPSSAAELNAAGERAERQMLMERISSAEERATAAAAGRKPTVAFTGAFDYANPNPRIFPRRDEWRQSWDLTVNVSWALWDAGRSKAEAAEAAAAATAVRERLADLDSLIALEVRQRQLDIESATAVIAAAEDAVRSAEEARRVVGERFRVGVATSTEVLDAQVGLLQAELDRTRGLANLKLAEARLARALGR
jgi:outer membrane protein